MNDEDMQFLLEVADQELIGVELDGEFYVLSGSDAAAWVLKFMEGGDDGAL